MYQIDLDVFVTGTRDDRDDVYADARRAQGEGSSAERLLAGRRYDTLSRMAYSTWWPELLEEFLSWPPGQAPAAVGDIIKWLREDPFALHTGYVKQRILRRLRRFTFAEPQAELLREAILAMLQRGPRQEFAEIRRLARRVDSPGFRQALTTLSEDPDQGTAERARLTLGLCRRNDQ